MGHHPAALGFHVQLWLLVSTTRIAFYASGAARNVRRSRASSATRDPRVADTETWQVSSPHRRLGCKPAVDRRSVVPLPRSERKH